MHCSPHIPGTLAFLILAASCLAECAGSRKEALLVYRLRGEVRPLLFWVGRDEVGGGRITIRRSDNLSTGCWREEIEVLFGSDPERIPKRINRWGYGRESADWIRDNDAPAPRLLGTQFQGIMRHSPESSVEDVVAESKQGQAAHRYDLTWTTVLPGQAYHELRILTDGEEFHYRRPDRLLSKYRECLASTPPLRRKELLNASRAYGAPYGFLTGLWHALGQITGAYERSPHALQRTRPSLTFVFNAKPYLLEVVGIRSLAHFQNRYGTLRFRDVAVVEFRCFNTVKRTRTEFSLWVPLQGEFKGLPIRVLLQPRWWLRLQLDLDAGDSRLVAGEHLRAAHLSRDWP